MGLEFEPPKTHHFSVSWEINKIHEHLISVNKMSPVKSDVIPSGMNVVNNRG